MKAFFTPSYVLTYLPNDEEAIGIIRDAAMLPGSAKDSEWKRTTSLRKALQETQIQMFRFRDVPKEKFEFILTANGYGRKLDILIKYFEIPKEKIIEGLFTICQVNNEQETTLEEKEESVSDSSVQESVS